MGLMKKLIFILSVLSSFFMLDLHARQDRIRFERLSIEQGLSQSSVISICQDHRGFLWFGTYEGMNRYDGYQFKIYKNAPNDSTSLTI
jgi:ligand-binding sensor domain-containing protein